MTDLSTSIAAPHIVVLGSLNMDLVVRVARAPGPGETITGRSIASIPGGKGGNQAVSCARQGARVSFVGCVGTDPHGDALCDSLLQDGIDLSAVRREPRTPTGAAVVTVEDSGQNRIVVIPGANAQLEVDLATLQAQLKDAAFLVTQFETPMAQVANAIALAARHGCKVLLNPSPMQPIGAALWQAIDTLVVNEVEAEALTGQPAANPPDAAGAGRALRARGVARVVVTLGARGAVAVDADGARHHPAREVEAVDTTAAGDTFLGALAVALATGGSLDDAVRMGMRAAALCIARPGAQPSIPTRDAVLRSPIPPDWTTL